MNLNDEFAKQLVAEALTQAGVQATDGDLDELRTYAFGQYYRETLQNPLLSRSVLREHLVEAIAERRHRDWLFAQYVPMIPDKHQPGLGTLAKEEGVSVNEINLTVHERDVLFLMVAMGMSQTQIIEKLGASGDWVEVAMAKIKSLYGPVWMTKDEGGNDHENSN